MKKENQLLTRVLKAVGLGNEADVEAKTVEGTGTDTNVEAGSATEVIELVVNTSDVQAELESFKEKLEAVTGELQGKLDAAISDLADMTSKFEAAKAALEAVEAEKAKLIADALAAKLAVRKEKVVAAIGTEKADGLMAATEGLDDAAFEAVVSALAGSVAAEANSNMFKEVGVDAKADAAKVVEENGTAAILRKKYSK